MSSELARKILLNSGYEIPIIGLGTWLSNEGDVAKAVSSAVQVGYRHFDCAYAYMNQFEIGNELNRLFNDGIVKVSFFY